MYKWFALVFNARRLHLVRVDSWLCRTDPADVARVESKTVICTDTKRDTVPITGYGVRGVLGQWISPKDMEKAYMERFPHCMKGTRTAPVRTVCRLCQCGVHAERAVSARKHVGGVNQKILYCL